MIAEQPDSISSLLTSGDQARVGHHPAPHNEHRLFDLIPVRALNQVIYPSQATVWLLNHDARFDELLATVFSSWGMHERAAFSGLNGSDSSRTSQPSCSAVR